MLTTESDEDRDQELAKESVFPDMPLQIILCCEEKDKTEHREERTLIS